VYFNDFLNPNDVASFTTFAGVDNRGDGSGTGIPGVFWIERDLNSGSGSSKYTPIQAASVGTNTHGVLYVARSIVGGTLSPSFVDFPWGSDPTFVKGALLTSTPDQYGVATSNLASMRVSMRVKVTWDAAQAANTPPFVFHMLSFNNGVNDVTYRFQVNLTSATTLGNWEYDDGTGAVATAVAASSTSYGALSLSNPVQAPNYPFSWGNYQESDWFTLSMVWTGLASHRAAARIGAAGIGFCYGVYVFFFTLIFGGRVPGYASMVMLILFLGGIQLISIGVISEYIGHLFMEVKNRPLFVVRETKTPDEEIKPANP
jgi:hypothetical protein